MITSFDKFLVAVIGAVVSYLVAHYGTNVDWVNAVVLVATALSVYLVPNKQ